MDTRPTYSNQATSVYEDGSEFQSCDVEQVLTTKRARYSLVERVTMRVGRMFSPQPIINNIIAFGVIAVALFVLNTQSMGAEPGGYTHYLSVGLLLIGGLQILKSATRSLLIPTLMTAAGAFFSHHLIHDQTFLTYGADFYQYVMFAGLMGLGISALNMR